MVEYCRHLDLYDTETGELTEWATTLWDSVDVRSTALLDEIDDPEQLFQQFCDRYGIEPAEAQDRKRTIILREHVRDRFDIPGRCPHQPIDGAETCPFHLPPEEYAAHGVTSEEVVERLIQKVRTVEDGEQSRLSKCFARVRMRSLDLSYRTLSSDDSYPINLKFGDIGRLELDNARIEESIYFDVADINHTTAEKAVFLGEVSFADATFGPGDVDFEQAEFHGATAGFANVSVSASTLNFERTVFKGADLIFEGAEIARDSVYSNPEVKFNRASVEDADADFEGVEFGQSSIEIETEETTGSETEVTITTRIGGRSVAGVSTYLVTKEDRRQPIGQTDDDGQVTVELSAGEEAGSEASLIEAQYSGLTGQYEIASGRNRGADSAVTVEFNRFALRNGDGIFKNCRFHGPAQFRFVEVDGQVAEFTLSKFFDRVLFESGRFDITKLDVSGAEFYGRIVDLTQTDFPAGVVEFQSAEFNVGRLDAADARFGGDDLIFTSAEINADVVCFDRVQFDNDDVLFGDTVFDAERVVFDDSTLKCDTFSMAETRLNADAVSLTGIDGGADDLIFERTNSAAPIDLQGSNIDAGIISQPSDGETEYYFDEAVVGDVDLRKAPELPIFERFRFLETDFDGFRFSKHNRQLANSEWKLHRVIRGDGRDPTADDSWRETLVAWRHRLTEYWSLASEGPKKDTTPAPSRLENTYRKAKNGADTVGDTKAVSEFFQKELFHRRRKHGRQIWDRDNGIGQRLRAARRWLYNYLLGSVTGYGEEPRRVLGWSVLIIIVFFGIYEMAWQVLPNAAPTSYEGAFGSMVLSLESFTTLVLGAGGVDPLLIRLIGYVEGFIGAFLIALFVFTLTRSIRR